MAKGDSQSTMHNSSAGDWGSLANGPTPPPLKSDYHPLKEIEERIDRAGRLRTRGMPDDAFEELLWALQMLAENQDKLKDERKA